MLNIEPDGLQCVESYVAGYRHGFAHDNGDARKRFRDHKAIPAFFEVPRAVGGTANRQDRYARYASHEHGAGFEFVLGPSRTVGGRHDRVPAFHHALLVAKGEGATLISRTANHLGPPGAGDALRNVAIHGPGNEKAGLKPASEPAPDQHRADDMMLVPVGRCADRLPPEEGLDILLADDVFEAVCGCQQLDEPAQDRKAQKIVQTASERHAALGRRAAAGLDGVEMVRGLVVHEPSLQYRIEAGQCTIAPAISSFSRLLS